MSIFVGPLATKPVLSSLGVPRSRHYCHALGLDGPGRRRRCCCRRRVRQDGWVAGNLFRAELGRFGRPSARFPPLTGFPAPFRLAEQPNDEHGVEEADLECFWMLPDELLMHLFTYLPVADLGRVAQVKGKMPAAWRGLVP